MLLQEVGRVGLTMCSVGEVADRLMVRGNFGVNMGWPIVTNGEFVALLCENMLSNQGGK